MSASSSQPKSPSYAFEVFHFYLKQAKLPFNNDQPCVKQKPVKTKFWINSKTTFQIPLNFWTINSFMKLEKIIKIGKGGLGEVKCPKNKKKCH